MKTRLLRLLADEGGWLNLALTAAPLVGKLLSGGARGAEQSRLTRDELNLQRDRLVSDAIANRERALVDRARLDMDRRDADARARAAGAKQALYSQYLQNWTPAGRPSGVPMIRGGFNTIPQASHETAAEMERQAMLRLLNGEQFEALPEMERFTLTPLSKPGLWEKLSGYLGLGLQGLGAFNGGGLPGATDVDPRTFRF